MRLRGRLRGIGGFSSLSRVPRASFSTTSPWRAAHSGASSSESFNVPNNAVVFSGIQPTGIPHLGNYLGALRQWVGFQNAAAPGTKLFYSIVDLHAITVPQRPESLRQWRREALAALLAIGLDPKKSVIFFQSSVAAHSELMWILSCTASVGYLSRMTQWKSKLSISEDSNFTDEKVKQSLKLGLFSYPVLQAADILVHRATHVPVGEDQRQHLEFARECATNFNHAYGQQLIAPETILSPARRVMSLQQPTQKMSKSHADPRSRILLTDTAEEVRRKIMTALTDSENSVSYDPAARPGVANLLELLSAFGNHHHHHHGGGEAAAATTPAELGGPRGLGGAPLKELKAATAAAVARGLAGIRERYLELLSEPDGGRLDEVAREGAAAARANAEKTMEAVRDAVGFSL